MASLTLVRSTPRVQHVDLSTVLNLDRPGPAAPRLELSRGVWSPPPGLAAPVLLADGALLGVTGLMQREGAQLLGPGDLLRSQGDGAGPFAHRWRALTPCTLAVLDEAVWKQVTRRAEVLEALLDAMGRQSSASAVQVVLAQLTTIDDRLRVLFAALTERWGVVTGNGVVLPSFLTHGILSALVGARRPSLTAAVGRMQRNGTIERLPDRRWRLAPEIVAVP